MSCKLPERAQVYMLQVERQEIPVCKEQIALMQMVRRCFETEDIYVDAEQYEHYLSLSKYFDFERLFPWQEFITCLHLCTYRADGLPRWPILFCELGRGAGKDGTIAYMSICETSPYNKIPKYDVDICANNEEQSMRPVQDIIESFERPKYLKKLKRHFYWNKESITGLKTKSKIRGRTNNPKGRDGMRSGAVVFNEIHQYQNYDNINVFVTGLGKRPHPRTQYFTTNGDVREGPLDDLLETSAGILFGGEPDNGMLPFICKLDSKNEVHDPLLWEKANPSLKYLPSLKQEIADEYRTWKIHPETLPAFMSKRMNLPQGASEVAVTDYANIKATNHPRPTLEGLPCVCGIDYANISDFASCIFHFKKDGARIDIQHSWLCLQSRDLPRIKAPWKEWARMGLLTLVDDVEIHPELIAAHIKQQMDYNEIRMLAMDNNRYALVTHELADIGFDAKSRKNIKLVRPSDIMRVQPVIGSCFANQSFVWGDDPMLRWATNNVKVVASSKKIGCDTGNFYYAKIEAKSRKTDPFMALAAAMTIEDILPDGAVTLPSLGVIT